MLQSTQIVKNKKKCILLNNSNVNLDLMKHKKKNTFILFVFFSDWQIYLYVIYIFKNKLKVAKKNAKSNVLQWFIACPILRIQRD